MSIRRLDVERKSSACSHLLQDGPPNKPLPKFEVLRSQVGPTRVREQSRCLLHRPANDNRT